uniref:rRNA N-glycosylase n=1 Tax=Leersia perrieri TaxID=77586 RepID=A0A0D9UX70_9ORYZ
MALNPLFTETFKVRSRDHNHNKFIKTIRTKAADPGRFSRDIPVLPPAEEPPRRWFHVVLIGTQTVTLAVRGDNLYLEGFRGSDGTWWELTPGIIGDGAATYAGFGGSYLDLIGGSRKLVDVTLGPEEMARAINTLAARMPDDIHDGKAQRRARESLVVLLLMVNEAVRFKTVAGMVAGLMNPRATVKSGTISDDMRGHVNEWHNLSKALRTMYLVEPKYMGKVEEEKVDVEKTKAEKEDEEKRKARKAAEKVYVEAANVLGIMFVDDKVPGGMTKEEVLALSRGRGKN